MDELDEIIHQPVRLQIMAALAAFQNGSEVEFLYLRDRLKLTDGNLSTHLSKLEEARYIKQIKTFSDRKPRTFVQLTPRGRAAFDEHVGALKELLRLSRTGKS